MTSSPARNSIYGLSLTRPWPFAFRHGKRVENRGWRPSGRYVGCYIALHAAKSYSEADRCFIAARTGLYVPSKDEASHSQIFAVCRWQGEIILPTPQGKFPGLIPTGQELSADQEKWFFGPFGWLLSDYVELIEPVPCTGAMGLWSFDKKPDVLQLLRERYAQAIKERKQQNDSNSEADGNHSHAAVAVR